MGPPPHTQPPPPNPLSNPISAHPDSTPSTRLSIKKEPMMMRGMKYSQFQVFPEASLLCGGGGGEKLGVGGGGGG